MRPFQTLRLWLRGGPTAERAFTAVVAALVLALAAWAVVPTSGNAPDDGLVAGPGGTAGAATGATVGTTTGGPTQPATGQPGTTGAALPGTGSTTLGPAVPGSTAGSTATSGTTTGTTTGTTGGTGSPVPRCPTGATDQGVTASQITIGVVVPDLGAANETIGLPSKEDSEKAYNAVLADYNKRGGVQCRKVVAKYYSANPVDASSEHAACLQMQSDKIFAAINNLFNAQEHSCIARARIPNFWYTPPATSMARQYAPYIISHNPDYARLIRTYVQGAKAVGWFAGAGKIGILESNCIAENIAIIRRELTAAGFPAARWSEYNYGCPANGIGTPDKQTAAVLQFKREGVTHVLSVAYSQSTQFSRAADQQDYKPKFAVMSDGQVQATDRATSSGGRSMDGALAITTDSIGAENTSGFKFSAATQRCRQLIKGAGLRDPVDPMSGTAGPLYGGACAQIALFVAAATNAPTLTRAALSTGLTRTGALDLSFPAGPANITDLRMPTGGQFWRTVVYRYSCNCWVVTSAKWRPDFS